MKQPIPAVITERYRVTSRDSVATITRGKKEETKKAMAHHNYIHTKGHQAELASKGRAAIILTRLRGTALQYGIHGRSDGMCISSTWTYIDTQGYHSAYIHICIMHYIHTGHMKILMRTITVL